MNPNVTASFAIVKTLKKMGVKHCVISPGSRSTPIAYAAIEELKATIIVDERDAGFVALGIAESSKEPCIVITTSGSAPAHLYPSVVEAFYSNVGLIVISADRPKNERGIGQPQTINQENMFGSHMRLALNVDDPNENDDIYTWVQVAKDLYDTAHRGPVHLNIGFREPLSPDGDESSIMVEDLNQEKRQHEIGFNSEIINSINNSEKIIITVGRSSDVDHNKIEKLSREFNICVLADTLSNIRYCDDVIGNYDFILRCNHSNLEPDLVIQFGNPLTSKKFNQFISKSDVIAVKNIDDGFKPYPNVINEIISIDMNDFVDQLINELDKKNDKFIESWRSFSTAAKKIDYEYTGEIAIYKKLNDYFERSQKEMNLLLASSMPIRYGEWFLTSIPENSKVFSHRGTNGIDGMVSSSLGIALGTSKNILTVLGDVALTHDLGFINICNKVAKDNKLKIILLLIDNGGGAIFSHLDQAVNEELAPYYEQLFMTHTENSWEKICDAYDIDFYEEKYDSNLEIINQIFSSTGNGLSLIKIDVEYDSGKKDMEKINNLLSNIH